MRAVRLLTPSLALLLACSLGGAGGCAQGETAAQVLAAPPPPLDQLPAIATTHAQRLGRTTCAGCPDGWMSRPCNLLDELQRDTPLLEVVACAAVAVPDTPPGVPERLAPRLEAQLEPLVALVRGARRDQVDQALRLYALGADLQRLGTLELWRLGLLARSQALAILSATPRGQGWPRELLVLEGAAPAPGRVGDVAVLQRINQLNRADPGWKARAALGRASKAALEAVRAPPDQREVAVVALAADLAEAWAGEAPPHDVVGAWAAAELVRHRTVELALRAALRDAGACPAALGELVPDRLPHVPEGWSLDPEGCTLRAPPVPGRSPEAADSDGADALPGAQG